MVGLWNKKLVAAAAVPRAAIHGALLVITLEHHILRTDISGMPLEWITYQDAVRLYTLDEVVYTCGTAVCRIHGGHNARSGRRSIIDVHSIIATEGTLQASMKGRRGYVPPLNNATLFRRDDYLCMYCGQHCRVSELSRDHVRPMSRGGEDTWANVVAACKGCNNQKGNLTPEQAGLQLLAVPFVPTHAEYVYLQGRRILADQMEFLRAHFPRRSRLHRQLGASGPGQLRLM